MRLRLLWMMVVSAGAALAAAGAERKFDFGPASENPPPGFRSTVSGEGKPGQWKVVLDDTPPALSALTPGAPSVSKRAVLAQVARDRSDQHFPLLMYDDEVFGDFTLTTQFKIVDGAVEQMAGVAFRIQDERNYYYVRASALGNNFYFFWFVDGQLLGPIGVKLEITR